MTTASEIRSWLVRGKTQGASHMLVVVDSFDHEDYPVYVQPNQNAQMIVNEYNKKEMQYVIEVYSLLQDFDFQIKQHRCFNVD